MKLITPDIEIPEDDPFKNDILDRKNYAEALTNLILSTDDPLVISVNAQWGEGKTTFAKMWSAHLQQNSVHSICFDAFEHDFLDDAFIPIVSEITSYFENIETDKDNSTLVDFKDKAAKVGGRLLTWAARVGVKAATLGAVRDTDIEALQDIGKDLAKDASSVVGDFVHERISNHEKEKQTLSDFRELLSTLPGLIDNDPNGSDKLVIIIDELDRCKPTFALQVIERIKHILSVPKVIFVLMMYGEQLEKSVECVYGAGIDARTYLQKFVSIEADLPKQSTQLGFHEADHYEVYIESLMDLHGLKISERNTLIYSLAALCSKFDFSLRQIQKAFTNILVFYSATSMRSPKLEPLISFLAAIQVFDRKVFNELKHGNVDFESLLARFPVFNLDDSDSENRGLVNVVDCLRYCTLSRDAYDSVDNNDRIRRFSQIFLHLDIKRAGVIPYHINKMAIVKVN